MPRITKIVVGARFGRLVIVSILSNKKVVTKCDCGTDKIVWRHNLLSRRNNTRSCGCLHREGRPTYAQRHGMYRHPTYSSWCAMKARCLNPFNHAYHYYGGRGITICERWLSFDNSLARRSR